MSVPLSLAAVLSMIFGLKKIAEHGIGWDADIVNSRGDRNWGLVFTTPTQIN
jgi:hypothetical protein